MKLATWYQLSYDEMKQLTKNALAGAFLSPDEKKLLNQKLIKHIYSKKEPPLKWRFFFYSASLTLRKI